MYFWLYFSLNFIHFILRRFSRSKLLKNIYTKELIEDYDYESSNNSFFTKIEHNFQVSFNIFNLYCLYIIIKLLDVK